jgi:hypothetical protein
MHRQFKFNLFNNCITVDYNYNCGHEFGQGQLSPDHKFNFIHISKNASSEAKQVLTHWKYSNYTQLDSTIKHLAILRDPTDRWISGIAEFLIGNNSHMGLCNSEISIDEIESILNTKMFQNVLFDFVIFDGHTLPQCCYLESLNLDNISFFYFDKTVIPRILDYVGDVTSNSPTNSNNSLTNQKKLVIIKKLKSLLEYDSKLQQKIDVHYWADHQLFDKVKFIY